MGRTPELFGVWKVMLDDWGVFKAGRYRMITPPPPPHKTKKKKKNIARILLEIRGLKYVGKCWNLQPMLLVGLTLYWDRWLHPPAELTNPSQLVTPSCIFVCVSVCTCVSPKKKSTGKFAVVKMVNGSVLVLVCVYVHMHRVICFLKMMHKEMPQYCLGKCELAG